MMKLILRFKRKNRARLSRASKHKKGRAFRANFHKERNNVSNTKCYDSDNACESPLDVHP